MEETGDSMRFMRKELLYPDQHVNVRAAALLELHSPERVDYMPTQPMRSLLLQFLPEDAPPANYIGVTVQS